jgi:hypothetical protein
MKKYFKYYILALLMVVGLSSCLEGEPPFEPDGGPAGIVELFLAARTSATANAVRAVTVPVAPSADLPVIINYTGIKGAPADTKVVLAIDNSYLPSNRTAVPTDWYEVPSFEVTIPKGQKTATLNIKLKTNLFDTKAYSLGVKIVSASSGTVSGNYSAGIYNITITR